MGRAARGRLAAGGGRSARRGGAAPHRRLCSVVACPGGLPQRDTAPNRRHASSSEEQEDGKRLLPVVVESGGAAGTPRSPGGASPLGDADDTKEHLSQQYALSSSAFYRCAGPATQGRRGVVAQDGAGAERWQEVEVEGGGRALLLDARGRAVGGSPCGAWREEEEQDVVVHPSATTCHCARGGLGSAAAGLQRWRGPGAEHMLDGTAAAEAPGQGDSNSISCEQTASTHCLAAPAGSPSWGPLQPQPHAGCTAPVHVLWRSSRARNGAQPRDCAPAPAEPPTHRGPPPPHPCRLLQLDRDTLLACRLLLRCTVELGTILLWFYVADRTPAIAAGQKASGAPGVEAARQRATARSSGPPPPAGCSLACCRDVRGDSSHCRHHLPVLLCPHTTPTPTHHKRPHINPLPPQSSSRDLFVFLSVVLTAVAVG